jgi:hypothetical protein
MFPVTTQSHWRQLARLQLSTSKPSAEDLWKTLESFDRDPELAHQVLNRLLAKAAPISLMPVDADPKQTAQSRRDAIEALLSPHDSACQKQAKKTA